MRDEDPKKRPSVAQKIKLHEAKKKRQPGVKKESKSNQTKN